MASPSVASRRRLAPRPANDKPLPQVPGAKSSDKEGSRLTSLRSLILQVLDPASGHLFWPTAVALLVFEAALTYLIIRKVPYTEIDYSTYLQQANLFLKGERHYSRIAGDSGPCVYPALHLYVYSFFSWLHGASDGRLLPAQLVFGLLYLVNQLCVMAIYKAAGAPHLLLPALVLSKRLHSIYVLRLFNDPIAMTLVYAAIWTLCKRKWTLGSTLFSLALGIKMNVLLFLPALAIIQFRAQGFVGALAEGLLIVLVQIFLGLPFLLSHPRAYLNGAFDLSRQFLYKWTVNLRFVDEETFLSPTLSRALLGAHAAALLLWALFRWTGIGRQGWRWLGQRFEGGDEKLMSAQFIAVSLLSSNLIGIAFSRSLHYQFYSWYAQSIPLLLWFSNLPLAVKLGVPLVVEWAWNTFPSTPSSSGGLAAAHALLLVGLWRVGLEDDTQAQQEEGRAKAQ